MKQLMNLKTSLNTSYLTDPYIVFTLKMESVPQNTIFAHEEDFFFKFCVLLRKSEL